MCATIRPEAQKAFKGPVPAELLAALHKQAGSPTANWPDVFGADAGEFFHAWSVAYFVGQVAAAGKLWGEHRGVRRGALGIGRAVWLAAAIAILTVIVQVEHGRESLALAAWSGGGADEWTARLEGTAALLLALAGIATPISRPVRAALQPANERKPAPAFALKDSSGKTVKLKQYRSKVVLLDFWATWCHGCKQEIPWFSGFDKTYRAQASRSSASPWTKAVGTW